MTSEEFPSRRRAGGRASRRRARSAEKPAVNPAPPGQIGGAYRPLSDQDLHRIIDCAFRILEDIGMAEVPDSFAEIAVENGAFWNALGRLSYPRSLVEDIIAQAAKRFVLHGRVPKFDIEVGGERVYFGTGGAAVQTLDLDNARYRAATLQDLYDFARLVDRLDNISWFTRCCVATDVPDPFDLDINTAYALLAGTLKPIGTSFTLGEHVDPIIDMFDHALGGDGKFAACPFCKAHISPIISPLRYGDDAVSVIRACVRRKVPINAIIAAQSGATAPAPPAGMLAQSTAETLAALVLVNLLAPGHPMIFSNWPFVIDLRSGAFCGGGGEISLMNAGSAQISNALGLPSGIASSMSDAKAVDAQMGAEKAIAAVATGLAGGNLIYESAGMMASLLGASFEALVADNEMLGHIYRLVRGIEVNEESLGFETIKQVVTGEGHFLGTAQTMAAMERDYLYPDLADRDQPSVWADGGATDLWQRAHSKARQILAEHRPCYLSKTADDKIRAQFNIFLPLSSQD